MNFRVWLSILLCMSLLAGCSDPFFEARKGEESDTLGLTPDFSYEIEEQTPNVLINQQGYAPENSKVAVIQGKELELVFYVHNAASHEVVFEGTLKESGQMEAKEEDTESVRIYLADFSDLKKTGEYYLFQPQLGYSYNFSIKENIYDPLEKAALTMLQQATDSTSELCYQLAGLLMTKELYGEQVQETEKLDRICEQKVQLLLQAQDSESGSVYGKLSEAKEEMLTEQEVQQRISLAATAEFAGVMAMYAYQMENIDWNIANQCQNAAENAYRSIQNSLDNVSFDAGYFAATQLFRQTGRAKYAQAVGQYLSMKEEQKSYTEYDFTLFGDLAYLSSSYGVNLEWGELVMGKVMERAEQISLASDWKNYYVSSEREYYDVQGMLQDMSVLALVNYIITNHEYTTLQKNYLDYFLGRNPDAVCFMEGYGTRSIMEKEDSRINETNAALFYLLLQSTKL